MNNLLDGCFDLLDYSCTHPNGISYLEEDLLDEYKIVLYYQNYLPLLNIMDNYFIKINFIYQFRSSLVLINSIQDKEHFEYRVQMNSISQSFYKKEEMKKYILNDSECKKDAFSNNNILIWSNLLDNLKLDLI